MTHETLVSCIGKVQDDPDLQRVLASLGVTTTLTMPGGDIDARHSLHAHGLCLVFKPDAARLVLSAIQFVSANEEGYTTFAGPLPGGLRFSDSPADANAKLGTPFFSKPKLRREIWRKDHLELALNYTRSEPQQIAVVTVQVPFNS